MENEILLIQLFCFKNKIVYNNLKIKYYLFNTLLGHLVRKIKLSYLQVSKGICGRIIKIKLFFSKSNQYNLILLYRIYLLNIRLLQIGDKIAGRYGNKGIISYLNLEPDVPFDTLQYNYIDLITSPLGIPSRMNWGQLLESILGYLSYLKDCRWTLDQFNLEDTFIEYLYAYFYNHIIGLSYNTGIYNYSPYILTKQKIYNAYYGTSYSNSVLIGYNYYFKLFHMVQDKINIRSTSWYSQNTQQPNKGRSKKGAQRFGEMEIWALNSFSAIYTLKELLHIKSDDIRGRLITKFNLSMLSSTIKTYTTESFKILFIEFNTLLLNMAMKEFNILKENNYNFVNIFK